MANTRTLTVVQYGSVTAGKKAYIQAGLHADEAPGFLVMHHLMEMLDKADAAQKIIGQIILVPMANPIGVSQWRDEMLQGRFDFYNSINFNRKHLDLADQIAEKTRNRLSEIPEQNVTLIRKVMGEILAGMKPQDDAAYLKYLLLSLSYDADVVLDLHCDYQSIVHIYLGSPLWPDAADLPAQMAAEATLLAKVSGENPFDEACSRIWWDLAEKFPETPIPPACLAATVELRGSSDVSHELACADAENIFLFLLRRDFIEGRAPELPPLLNEATPLRGVEQIKAPVPGVVVFLKEPGDRIEKGDVLAEIVNPLKMDSKSRITRVVSGIDGILISVNLDRYARPGRILAKVAGKVPLKEKGENLLTL
jgi:predicted deacylase